MCSPETLDHILAFEAEAGNCMGITREDEVFIFAEMLYPIIIDFPATADTMRANIRAAHGQFCF